MHITAGPMDHEFKTFFTFVLILVINDALCTISVP